MKRNLIVLFSIALVAGAIAQTGRAEFRANLIGAGKGKATWKLRDNATQFQAELEVEGENMAKNTVFRVKIGTRTWNVTTNALGRFTLVQRYTTSTRPAIGVGTVVNVVRTNGAIALTGAFVQTR